MSEDTKIDQPDPTTLNVVQHKDETPENAVSRHLLRPTVNAAMTIQRIYAKQSHVTTAALTDELHRQMKHINDGNLEIAESMLMSQAHTLDALFTTYISKALNTGHYDWFKAYMNMALRSQSQCRAAIQTLVEVKNPRPYIQNNKAQYQQVNNGVNPARTGENLKSSNELLEDKEDGKEWVDTRETQEASGDDKELETVGK